MSIEGHVDEVSHAQVRGWAIQPRSSAPATIQVVVNGHLHGTCVADGIREGLGEFIGQPGDDAHAFEYEFRPALSMYREHRLEIRNAATNRLLPSGARTIHVIHAARGMLAPILITSRGRTGTTYLMKHLLAHPEVEVADTYPFEIELMTYYVSALNVLLAPRFDGTQDEPDMAAAAEEMCRIGRNPWNRPALHQTIGGEELERMFSESIPLRLSSLFRNIILDYYGIVARKMEKRRARFLAEKCGLGENTRQGIRGLMGEVKEIVLVRDPRDFFCSAKAFWRWTGEEILAMMDDVFGFYAQLAARTEHDTLLVRYEDLIEGPKDTLGRIGNFAGLTEECPEQEATELFHRHGTSASPGASIGRWRREMTAADTEHCKRRFGLFMEQFGYV